MITVRQLLQDKSRDLFSTSSDSMVFDAITIMADKRIGAMPVIDGERLVGMFSERDYLQKVVLRDHSSRETQVSEIMTTPVITITPDTVLSDCMVLMTEKRIRHLPVVEGGRVTGMISIGDALKCVINEKDFVIEQLGIYISGQT